MPTLDKRSSTWYDDLVKMLTGKATTKAAFSRWRKACKENGDSELVFLATTFAKSFHQHFHGDNPFVEQDLATFYCAIIDIGRALTEPITKYMLSCEVRGCNGIFCCVSSALKWLDRYSRAQADHSPLFRLLYLSFSMRTLDHVDKIQLSLIPYEY